MYLNLIGLGLVSILFAYLGYYAWSSSSATMINPIRSGFLVAQDTGKTKQNVPKTGHSSMNSELVRRRTIQVTNRINPNPKFNASLGSISGVIETYGITGICTCNICPTTGDILFDGGGASSEFCPIHDGKTYDAGNADTIVCGA